MTGWADAAHRARDAVMPALFGVMGPVGAIGAVVILVMRQALGRQPAIEYLIAAFAALIIGMLMVWARWRLATGHPAPVAIGALAILHALAGAYALRTAMGGGGGLPPTGALPGGAMGASAISGMVAIYALAMAGLLAWCVRRPIATGR